jgi:orotate phosphoribosyltransferase
VLKVCKDEKRFDATTLAEVEKFLNGPVAWSAAHGGISELKR